MTPADEVRGLVESLERHLGDPFDERSRMPFSQVLDLDEREAYPHLPLAALHAWGAHAHAVPARWGGKAVDIETSLQLLRQVARRDATTATALSITSLSYMPLWVAGNEEQRRHYAEAVVRGAKIAWGLSERGHGSDVLANEMRAERVPGGYRVTGEKWLIGNATLADYVVLHVRTRPSGGPAGFTLLVLDKRAVPAHRVELLPGERLHGLRGLDLSGVRVHDVFIPDSARIGAEGHGLEIALTAGHGVRSMITGIALGAADTGLRLTLDFATRRELFGQRVVDLPHSRRQLAGCYADLLVADAVVVACTRSLQVCPEQSSVFSSVAKYFVPALLQAALGRLAVVLGARHYLRAHPRFGPFQKALRDVAVADFADGNSVVNLKSIGMQLGALLDGARTPAAAPPALFDLDARLPAYEPWRQALASRGGDAAVRSLPHSAELLRRRGDEIGGRTGRQLREAARLAASFTDELDRLRTELDRLRARHGAAHAQRGEVWELARQYCLVHAAACVAGMWAHDRGDGLLPPPALALACLVRLRQQLRPFEAWSEDDDLVDETEEAVLADLLDRHEHALAFSLRRLQLQAAPPAALRPPRQRNPGPDDSLVVTA